jgi:hypothetical protein
MSLTRTALRLITLLFLLAGILLLRKPVFGQTIPAPSTQALPLATPSILEQPIPIMNTRTLPAIARPLLTNRRNIASSLNVSGTVIAMHKH